MAITDDHRRDVARAVGLPDDMAPQLRGGNLDQLMASAERLADEGGYVRRPGGFGSPQGALWAMRRDQARRRARLQRGDAP
jgi:hypothetical protein